MIPTAKLSVEIHLTMPANPMQFAVIAEGQPIAILTYEEVKRALAEFDRLKAIHEAAR